MDAALHADLGRAELDRFARSARRSPPRRPRRRRASACPWPNPQKAQPTTQMLVKLMLRLTTKVARSPASSARSSSAATRISSITSGRVSANSAVSSSSLSSSPSRPLAIASRGQPGVEVLLAPPPGPAPRDEAPVLQLDHVEDPLLHPLGVHVLRIDAEPLGQRIAPGRQLLPHLMRAGKRLLGRDVVAVGRQPTEIRRPGLDQLRPPVGQIRRHLHPDIRHQPLALRDQPLDLLDRRPASPSSARDSSRSPSGGSREGRVPSEPPQRSTVPSSDRASLVGDLRHLARRSTADGERSSGGSPPGCGRSARAARASASSDSTRSSSVSPMPTRIPLVKGIFSSPAASIVASRFAGCLVGEPAWTVSISRSETDSSIRPWRGGHLAQPRQVVAVEHAEVRVGQDAALQRPLAGPDHVGGEVLVAPLGQPRGDLGVDLGPLAGEDQQLLGVAPLGLVEARLDLLRRVDVRPVRRERAVLAVALAGARERERVVAREGDPAHAAQATGSTARGPTPGPPQGPAACQRSGCGLGLGAGSGFGASAARASSAPAA